MVRELPRDVGGWSRQKLPGINHTASVPADPDCLTVKARNVSRPMKITGPNATGSASATPGTRPAGSSGGFRLPDLGEASAASSSAGVNRTAGVMGVDALLALQDVGGPLERKRRAVRRAGRILDVLDEVKLALLDGDLSLSQLERLRRAIRDERGLTDDAKLEGVLDEIELRAAVEIAKLEQAAYAG